MAAESPTTPQDRAMRRLKDTVGFMWHLATFLIINGFLWFIDSLDDGFTWAYWVTISWGIGLAFHLAAFLIGEEDETNPLYQHYLDQEAKREERQGV